MFWNEKEQKEKEAKDQAFKQQLRHDMDEISRVIDQLRKNLANLADTQNTMVRDVDALKSETFAPKKIISKPFRKRGTRL